MSNDGIGEWGRPYQRFDIRKKMYRRRKKYQGDDINDGLVDRELLESAQRKRGLYCKECKRLQPWSKLTTAYRVVSGDIMRTWYCVCGNVLREDNMEEVTTI